MTPIYYEEEDGSLGRRDPKEASYAISIDNVFRQAVGALEEYNSIRLLPSSYDNLCSTVIHCMLAALTKSYVLITGLTRTR